MAGAPSQLELFDHKPELARLHGEPTPDSLLAGRRFAFIQGIPRLLGPVYPFARHGESGQWFTDRLPLLATQADALCFVKSMVTDQFNHGPAQMLMHTGSQNPGLPSAGSWVTYGLGSPNQDLPGFVVLTSGGKLPDAGKTVWGSGFLPSVFQGVQCRSEGDPVLFLANPAGVSRDLRRQMLDAIDAINRETAAAFGDPETVTRIAQYELAYRMQATASEAFSVAGETKETHELYGTEPGRESFANNCLLARRLVERGVRFVQLFDWGWDSHGAAASEALNEGFKGKCRSVDRPLMALLADLARRGLLDDTLVVWTGEFGRTPMHRPRPQPGSLHHLARRRRREGRSQPRGHRRPRLSGGRRSGDGARPARDDPAPAGLRSPAAGGALHGREPAALERHQAGQPRRPRDPRLTAGAGVAIRRQLGRPAADHDAGPSSAAGEPAR
jgi:hypothetical protein